MSIASCQDASTYKLVRSAPPSPWPPSLSTKRWIPWTFDWILKICIETESFAEVKALSSSGGLNGSRFIESDVLRREGEEDQARRRLKEQLSAIRPACPPHWLLTIPTTS